MLAFSPKSSCRLPKGHPNLEVFLSQLENEILIKTNVKTFAKYFCDIVVNQEWSMNTEQFNTRYWDKYITTYKFHVL